MPSSTSRSRSLDIDIRRYRGNPRASLDSRVENVWFLCRQLEIAVRVVVHLEAGREVHLVADHVIDLIADRVSLLARFLHEVPDLHGVIDDHVPDLLDAVTVHLPVMHDEMIVHGPRFAGVTDPPVVIALGLLVSLLLQIRLLGFPVKKSVLFARGC
ncbi:hypothetical protein DAPPUDRAFT_268825 [Daphnia pulex]|uniref:Uncharacterized protein n=1 Tax=Daphnia pulex TaxID=6669 RepID=E9HYF5_DAPPU|nr:hypothetical protein DAPPUDRAFT_268825 [Daphnia pulex]|eukprot:EFX63225.1 hypothetical protein DAPPUDRAFT_268825 [Daphnia pulex]